MSGGHGPELAPAFVRRFPARCDDGYDHDQMVRAAAMAIRQFAGMDVDREGADILLFMWRGFDLLSEGQRAAILRRFPERAR